MKRIGMSYRYSYKELWQPKNFPVIFRMYQLNLDGEQDRVYRKYWGSMMNISWKQRSRSPPPPRHAGPAACLTRIA